MLVRGYDTEIIASNVMRMIRRTFKGSPRKLKEYITEGGDCILHWTIAGIGMIAGVTATLGIFQVLTPRHALTGVVVCAVIIVVIRREFTGVTRYYRSRKRPK